MRNIIKVEEGRFRLVQHHDELDELDEFYLTLWHMHPEREKKQGLISDGRKCMSCDVVAPETIGGYLVEEDGYVHSAWTKAKEKEGRRWTTE